MGEVRLKMELRLDAEAIATRLSLEQTEALMEGIAAVLAVGVENSVAGDTQ